MSSSPIHPIAQLWEISQNPELKSRHFIHTYPGIVGEKITLTYAELYENAAKLASKLRSEGVSSEDAPPKIGVWLGDANSTEYVIALFAIWMLGGIYVPMPLYSQAQLDPQKAVFVGVKHMICPAEALELPCLETFTCHTLSGHETYEPLTIDSKNYDLAQDAYIVFSSGSTSKPKAMLLTFEGVASRFIAANNILFNKQYGDEPQTILGFFRRDFDANLFDIFLALYGAQSILLVPDSLSASPHLLPKFIQNADVKPNMMVLLPDMLVDLSHQDLGAPAQVMITGQVLLAAHLDSQDWREVMLSNTCQIWDGWGPTEATIGSSIAPIFSTDNDALGFPFYRKLPDSHLIGPLGDDVKLYFRKELSYDEEKESYRFDDIIPLDTALANSEGEILIGGKGLCTYINNPDLNAKFERHPHFGKLYPTNDKIQMNSQGSASFLTRYSRSIKHRGMFTNMDTIEHMIEAFELLVTKCIVIDRDRLRGSRILVAYVQFKADINASIQKKYFECIHAFSDERHKPDLTFLLKKDTADHGPKNKKRSLTFLDNTRLGLLHQATDRVEPVSQIGESIRALWHSIALGEYVAINDIWMNDELHAVGGSSQIYSAFITNLLKSFLPLVPPSQHIAFEAEVNNLFGPNTTLQAYEHLVLSFCAPNIYTFEENDSDAKEQYIVTHNVYNPYPWLLAKMRDTTERILWLEMSPDVSPENFWLILNSPDLSTETLTHIYITNAEIINPMGVVSIGEWSCFESHPVKLHYFVPDFGYVPQQFTAEASSLTLQESYAIQWSARNFSHWLNQKYGYFLGHLSWDKLTHFLIELNHAKPLSLQWAQDPLALHYDPIFIGVRQLLNIDSDLNVVYSDQFNQVIDSIPPGMPAPETERNSKPLKLSFGWDEHRLEGAMECLQQGSNQLPVFCCFPVTGEVLPQFKNLAHTLGSDVPVYALKIPQDFAYTQTLHELIDFYADIIQKIKPKGPYFLTGMSFGGFFAYLLAHALNERNPGSVPGFVNIDSPPPMDMSKTDPEKMAYIVISKICTGSFDWCPAVSFEQLSDGTDTLDPIERAKALFTHAIHFVSNLDVAQKENLWRLKKLLSNAQFLFAKLYDLTPDRLPVLREVSMALIEAKIKTAQFNDLNPFYQWSSFVGGIAHYVDDESDHFRVFNTKAIAFIQEYYQAIVGDLTETQKTYLYQQHLLPPKPQLKLHEPISLNLIFNRPEGGITEHNPVEWFITEELPQPAKMRAFCIQGEGGSGKSVMVYRMIKTALDFFPQYQFIFVPIHNIISLDMALTKLNYSGSCIEWLKTNPNLYFIFDDPNGMISSLRELEECGFDQYPHSHAIIMSRTPVMKVPTYQVEKVPDVQVQAIITTLGIPHAINTVLTKMQAFNTPIMLQNLKSVCDITRSTFKIDPTQSHWITLYRMAEAYHRAHEAYRPQGLTTTQAVQELNRFSAWISFHVMFRTTLPKLPDNTFYQFLIKYSLVSLANPPLIAIFSANYVFNDLQSRAKEDENLSDSFLSELDEKSFELIARYLISQLIFYHQADLYKHKESLIQILGVRGIPLIRDKNRFDRVLSLWPKPEGEPTEIGSKLIELLLLTATVGFTSTAIDIHYFCGALLARSVSTIILGEFEMKKFDIYLSSLRRAASGKWRQFPRSFLDVAQPYFRRDISTIHYTEFSQTIHGDDSILGSEIFFIGDVNLDVDAGVTGSANNIESVLYFLTSADLFLMHYGIEPVLLQYAIEMFESTLDIIGKAVEEGDTAFLKSPEHIKSEARHTGMLIEMNSAQHSKAIALDVCKSLSGHLISEPPKTCTFLHNGERYSPDTTEGAAVEAKREETEESTLPLSHDAIGEMIAEYVATIFGDIKNKPDAINRIVDQFKTQGVMGTTRIRECINQETYGTMVRTYMSSMLG